MATLPKTKTSRIKNNKTYKRQLGVKRPWVQVPSLGPVWVFLTNLSWFGTLIFIGFIAAFLKSFFKKWKSKTTSSVGTWEYCPIFSILSFMY